MAYGIGRSSSVLAKELFADSGAIAFRPNNQRLRLVGRWMAAPVRAVRKTWPRLRALALRQSAYRRLAPKLSHQAPVLLPPFLERTSQGRQEKVQRAAGPSSTGRSARMSASYAAGIIAAAGRLVVSDGRRLSGKIGPSDLDMRPWTPIAQQHGISADADAGDRVARQKEGGGAVRRAAMRSMRDTVAIGKRKRVTDAVVTDGVLSHQRHPSVSPSTMSIARMRALALRQGLASWRSAVPNTMTTQWFAPQTQPSAVQFQADQPKGAEAWRNSSVQSKIYLDGAALGRWVVAYLEEQVNRPRSGTTAFDPRLSPIFAGAPIGM